MTVDPVSAASDAGAFAQRFVVRKLGDNDPDKRTPVFKVADDLIKQSGQGNEQRARGIAA